MFTSSQSLAELQSPDPSTPPRQERSAYLPGERCRAEGCTNTYRGNRFDSGGAGYCPTHYRATLRFGNPLGADAAGWERLAVAVLDWSAAGEDPQARARLLEATLYTVMQGVRGRYEPARAAAQAGELLEAARAYAEAEEDSDFEAARHALPGAARAFARAACGLPVMSKGGLHVTRAGQGLP